MADDEIAPEIAALLSSAESDLPSASDFSFNDDSKSNSAESNESSSGSPGDVDLSIKQFKPIEKFFSDTPSPTFSDPAYYKTALSGENESSQKLHNLLTKYLKCTDAKDRTVYRQQMITTYWEFLRSIAPKMAIMSLPQQKRLLMRYAVVLPTLFTPEQKDCFSCAIFENNTGEPVYYLDEWFRGIATGNITLSATDEARPKKAAGATNSSDEARRIMQLQQKNSGKLQSSENLLNAKETERNLIEVELKARVDKLCTHADIPGMSPHKSTYDEMQRKMLSEVNERLKALLKVDKELVNLINEFKDAKEISDNLQNKLDSAGGAVSEVDKSDIYTELDTVRQMAKMTVGRQGNHFPVFTREFYHCLPKTTGFRENVIEIMTWIESVDSGAFCRLHRNALNRIIPYVILIPTYGDTGFCWEPFDRYNRVTSRGRIVVPMYPRDLKVAILTAVADLRWQVAKEKASYYWMEEGLTGQYYQWVDAHKLKGDLKELFIADYVLWMTKESEGVQRLDKDVRGIFWRHVPFSQEIKEKLKVRSLVYQELYQRDVNRTMSDGY